MGFEPTTSAVTGRRSNQLSHRAILKGLHLQNCTLNIIYQFILVPLPSNQPKIDCISSSFFWSSPRPISTSQLHTLLYFHLWPIYLVVFKGSYFLMEWDISS